MDLSKATKKSTVIFITAFLLCGVLHVVTFRKDFAETFVQLYCGTFTVLWGMLVKRHITDARLRKLMLGVVMSLVLFMLMQITRDSLLNCLPDDCLAMRRIIWYAYYIPVLALALLLLYISLSTYLPRNVKFKTLWLVPSVVCALIAVGFLTNDLHFLAFRFTGEIMDESHRVYGPLFYLYCAWLGLLLLLTYINFLKKLRRPAEKRQNLYPLIPIGILLLYVIVNAIWGVPRINNVPVWNTGEMYTFCTIAFLEICVQIGMIPANTHYEKLLTMTNAPAVILDNSGNVQYATKGTQYPFPKEEDFVVQERPISGGRVMWSVNVRNVRELNERLAEATHQIISRNAYLAKENKIKEEKAALETRNDLYNNITNLVQPQLDEIGKLLSDTEESFETRLKRISVISAYIKRRSNMELSAENGTLPAVELLAATRESLDYAHICGINTAVMLAGAGTYSERMIISAYEHIEAVLEECLDTLSDLMIAVRAEQKRLIIRMMIKADSFTLNVDEVMLSGRGFSRQISIAKEDGDFILVLTFTEGSECV